MRCELDHISAVPGRCHQGSLFQSWTVCISSRGLLFVSPLLTQLSASKFWHFSPSSGLIMSLSVCLQNGQPGLLGRDDARMAAGALDPGDNPLGFMAARPFLGQSTAGLLCFATHTDPETR